VLIFCDGFCPSAGLGGAGLGKIDRKHGTVSCNRVQVQQQKKNGGAFTQNLVRNRVKPGGVQRFRDAVVLQGALFKIVRTRLDPPQSGALRTTYYMIVQCDKNLGPALHHRDRSRPTYLRRAFQDHLNQQQQQSMPSTGRSQPASHPRERERGPAPVAQEK